MISSKADRRRCVCQNYFYSIFGQALLSGLHSLFRITSLPQLALAYIGVASKTRLFLKEVTRSHPTSREILTRCDVLALDSYLCSCGPVPRCLLYGSW